MKKPAVLILNAALNGSRGNTAALLSRASTTLSRQAKVTTLVLDERVRFAQAEPILRKADAVIFGTGTYWDSWSHRLQRFLEAATPTEGTALWLGKPAGVLVTMHSVGGKGALSRLQGVLGTFGCVIPPMSGLVYSLVNQAALESGTESAADVWCQADVDIVCHNLLAALNPRPRYKAWPVDRAEASARWIKP